MNMNLMKKFEQPIDFKNKLIKEVMSVKPRKQLDHFKTKPAVVETRERANTLYEYSSYNNKNNTYTNSNSKLFPNKIFFRLFL